MKEIIKTIDECTKKLSSILVRCYPEPNEQPRGYIDEETKEIIDDVQQILLHLQYELSVKAV